MGKPTGFLEYPRELPLARRDIERLCAEAREHDFHAVCVNGSRVELARSLLDETTARVVALVLPMHLLLDGMWVPDLRVSLLWPWAGSAFPPLHEVGVQGLVAHLLHDLADPVNVVGELGGLLVLVFLWRWCGLADAARRVHLWHTGALIPLARGAKAEETLA